MRAEALRLRALTRVFLARFFESETDASTDARAGVFWLVACLAAPGFVLPIYLGLGVMAPTVGLHSDPSEWGWSMIARFRGVEALRTISLTDKTMYVGYALAIAALMSAIVWQRLLADRRDALILGGLPVRARTIVTARLTAIAGYVLLVAASAHLLASISFGAFLAAGNSPAFALRGIASHFLASLAATAFVFFAIVGAQGALLTLAGPRVFARVSLVLQLVSVAAVTVGVFALPFVGRSAIDTIHASGPNNHPWLLWMPQMWFLGVYEWLLGTTDPVLVQLARVGGISLAGGAGLTLLAYPISYHRMSVAAVEQAALRRPSRAGRVVIRVAALISRGPAVRAIVEFYLLTIARVDRHRFAITGALGLSVVWLMAAGVPHASTGTALLAFFTVPVLAVVLLLTSLRVAAGLPSELSGAWLFDVTTPSGADVRTALTRTWMTLVVWPVTVVSAVVIGWKWGIGAAVVHLAFLPALGWCYSQVFALRLSTAPCTGTGGLDGLDLRKRWPLFAAGFLAVTTVPPVIEYTLILIPLATPLVIATLVAIAAFLRRAAAAHDAVGNTTAVDVLTAALQDPKAEHGPIAPLPHSDIAPLTNEVDSWWGLSGLKPSAIGRDVRVAMRTLVRSPTFCVFSILTLSAGIAATTGTHAMVAAVQGRAPEVRDLDSLAVITAPRFGSISWLDFADLRGRVSTFSAAESSTDFPSAVSSPALAATLASGTMVTGGYFQMLGVRAVRGRMIEPADDAPRAAPVAVVSDRFWRTRLASDPSVVGSVVHIGGEPFTVVGIAPPTFAGIRTGNLWTGFWVAMSHPPPTNRDLTAIRDPARRTSTYLRVIGRMAPGKTIEVAQTEVTSIAQALDREAPIPSSRTRAGVPLGRSWAVTSLRTYIAPPGGWGLVPIVALPVLVLLIACATLANLALARGASRSREFAVRRALGASRWDLVRSLAIEHGLLALVGGAGGILLASGIIRIVAASARRVLGASPQYQFDVPIAAGSIATAFAAAALAFVIVGLIPAISLTRWTLRPAIEPDVVSLTASRWGGRARVITAQVAATVMLLLLAAAALREAWRMTNRADPIDSAGLAVLDVPFSLHERDDARVQEIVSRTLQRLAGDRRIRASAAISNFPMSALVSAYTAAPDAGLTGADAANARAFVSGTAGMFTALGLPIDRGRAFDAADESGRARVAVINEGHARALFGTADAVGRTMLMRVGSGATNAATIVGVTPDLYLGAGGSPISLLFVPLSQVPRMDVTFVARTAPGQESAVTGVMQAALRSEAPDAAPAFAGPAEMMASAPAVATRIMSRITSGLALVALSLSMIGLYGVLSQIVASRTRELGIRAALGARRRHMLELVAGDAARPLVIGVIVGLALAGIGRLSMPMFQGPLDWATISIAAGPLLLSAFIATMLPAWRASRIDPAVALRTE